MSGIIVVEKDRIGLAAELIESLEKAGLRISDMNIESVSGIVTFSLQTNGDEIGCEVLRTAGFNVQERKTVPSGAIKPRSEGPGAGMKSE